MMSSLNSSQVLRMERIFLPHLTTLLFHFASVLNAIAQKDPGSIVGTVRDSTGAIIRGATITVTTVDQGISFHDVHERLGRARGPAS